ncbi:MULTISPECIES: hypothetical protein [Chryseobacterium]|uniref:hypothetical protein n=1 Tax=Chryseobacterium sp. R2A-55 TaxID=2744445 RepID=UPI001F35247F|nr:hypothetical protein [Chryseobacterium sp. R2A-55]
MNRKSLLFFVLLCCSGFGMKAQMTMHKLLTAGYEYQNLSFGEVGGKLLFLNNDDLVYRLGVSALMGSVDSKFVVIPKVQGDILMNFERNVDFYHSWYFLAGAEVTTKFIAPKIGFTLFGIVDLTGGYAFPLDQNGINGKKLNGFNLNFTVNLPIPFLNDMIK